MITTIVGQTQKQQNGFNQITHEFEHRVSFEEREIELERESKRQENEYKESKKSPYNSFTQLNKETYLMALVNINPTASVFFLFFLYKMNKFNEITIKQKTLEDVLNISHATLYRALKYLEETKYICVKRDESVNTYIVNPYIAWNNYGNRISYCRFEKLERPKIEQPFKDIGRLYNYKGILKLKTK